LNEKKGWKQKIIHEFAQFWAIAFYLSLFFGVFTNYRRLILAQYGIGYEAYGFSVIKALVLAKVILVAEELRLGRKFQDIALIFLILKTAVGRHHPGTGIRSGAGSSGKYGSNFL
jgi:hypothetical protein